VIDPGFAIIPASSKVTMTAARRVLHFEYAAAVSSDQGLRLHVATH
jgi:hypothetical protein